jgi:membrane complex biogenesis BtpA family protein
MQARWLEELFGVDKPIIAMVHFPALPGSPLYDHAGGIRAIVDHVRRDVEALTEAGVDGLLFCNENDRPYTFDAPTEAIATMAHAIGLVRDLLDRPFGVDVLWDPPKAVALAAAVGASFVREVFTGTYESDMGPWVSRAAEALRLRSNLGVADSVRLCFNVSAEFASPLGRRSVVEIARSVAFSSLPDALCVSGPMTGAAIDASELVAVREGVPEIPIIANTGVRRETVGTYLAIADAAIVGTALKEDGVTFNPVDPLRAKEFMETVRQLRAEHDAR